MIVLCLSPSPVHAGRPRLTTAQLFIPCVVCCSMLGPHIIGFVVCANYIHHQPPIIGSLSHSNWDFLSPSCHHGVNQRGSVNIWGRNCFITGKCFLHDPTTCPETWNIPIISFNYRYEENIKLATCWIIMSLEESFWHINNLLGGYLTPPSIDFYFVVGGKHGLVKFRDDQWWSFPWPEEGPGHISLSHVPPAPASALVIVTTLPWTKYEVYSSSSESPLSSQATSYLSFLVPSQCDQS